MGQQTSVLSASFLAMVVSTALAPLSPVRAEPSPNASPGNLKRIVYRPGAIPPRPGDLNADGFIDTQDLLQMVHFLSTPPLTPDDAAYTRADLTGDGMVDERDLTRLLELLTVAASPRGCPSVNNCCAFPIAFGGCCDLPGECIGIPGPGGGPDDPEPPEGGGGPGGIGGGGGGPGDGGPGSIGNPPGGGNGGGNPPPPECGFYITVAYPFEPADPPHSIPQIPRVGVGYIHLRAELTIGQFVDVDWYLVENGVVPTQPTLPNSTIFTIAPDSPGQYEVRAKRTCGENNTFETGTTVDIFWANPHSVSFGGGNHLIKSDPRPGVASFEYAAPHWKDDDNDGEITPPPQGADRRYPVAYTRAATVTIDEFVPVLTMDHRSDPPATIYYKAIGPGGQEFTIGRTDNSTPITAPEPLENTIAYHGNYPLTWKISFDGQRVWYSMGSTSHELFTTLADPGDVSNFHSVYRISCEAGDGSSTVGEALATIWLPFQNRSVTSASGHTLGYYRGDPCGFNTAATDVETLLSDTNGQCLAWVRLYRQCLSVQGISSHAIYEIVPLHLTAALWDHPQCPDVTFQDSGMILADPAFPPAGGSGCGLYPFRTEVPCEGSAWNVHDVVLGPSLPGQDNPTPPGHYTRHFVVQVGAGAWYDPSYGIGPILLANEQIFALAWKHSHLKGFYTFLLNQGDPDVPFAVSRKPAPAALDVRCELWGGE